jgi:ribonuclease D
MQLSTDYSNSLPDSNDVKVTITADELNELPLKSYEGKVYVINDPEKLTPIAAELAQHAVLGFDTETRPSFKKGQSYKVALIQLALPNKVFLIRTHDTGLPPALIQLFENKHVVKTGVAIHDDIKALQKLHPFTPENFVELSTLARSQGIQVESVKKLTGLLLGFRISKSAQTSNWEAPTLTEKQIEYAATDAWVCLEIYKRLTNLETPPSV